MGRGRRTPSAFLRTDPFEVPLPVSVPPPASSEALFRYLVVSQIVALLRSRWRRADAVREVIGRPQWTPSGEARRVSARTAYRWLKVFEDANGEVTALEPMTRTPLDGSRVLPAPFLAFLRTQREEDPDASIPELIRRGRELGMLEAEEAVDRTTVYRAMRRMGLPTARRKQLREGRDSRKFAYPHRMQMVLCDGKHFRAGPTRLKRVALFFLDDASRYGLHVVVGTSENTRLFLRGLYELIERHGLLDMLYLDHGPGFVSLDTVAVVGQLALLLHGESAYPQGHGKVERFNQTGLADVLRHLAKPGIDPACGALEVRLQHYLSEVYNLRPHEGLGGKESPLQRWQRDERALRFPDDAADLRERFLVTATRRVSHDHVIRVGPDWLEVPRGLAGQTIEIYRHVLDDDRISILHRGRRVFLHPVDLVANARDRRAPPASSDEADAPTEGPLPPSAAELAYDRDLGPIVDPEGGFTDPDPEE